MKYEAELNELEECDVGVAGGGIAGVYAALAAAKGGANTVLIEQHAFVGGQGTAGGVHTFCGETRLVNDPWRQMLSGLGELDAIVEYRPDKDGRAFEAEGLKFVLQEMLAEAGVRLFLHTQLIDVERQGNRVVSLVIFNKSGLSRLACKQIVDATGDADVVARGGWPFLKGGPAFKPGENPEIDEESQPKQLPMSLYFTLTNIGHEVKPYLPQGCPSWKDDDDLPMTTVNPGPNRLVIKMKVIGFDATDGESLSKAEQVARRQMMGLVYHLQTKGYKGKRYPTYQLAWVSPHIGIREGRRVVAQHVMSMEDLLVGRHFEDGVAVGSYHVDYHWPNVVQRAGSGITSQCPPYQIPLRAMRPQEADNLLVPGRCMSGEQMAMSSFRVMGICAQTGFAAGTAAGLAVKEGCELDKLDIVKLRRRLREAGVRLDLAPYTNYLRRRRNLDESICNVNPSQISGLSVSFLPDGDVVCIWGQNNGSGWEIKRSIRHEESWEDPEPIFQGEDALGFHLYHLEGERLYAENVEEHWSGHPSIVETDSPPKLWLVSGEESLLSHDGGRKWDSSHSSPKEQTPGCVPVVLNDGSLISLQTGPEGNIRVIKSTDGGSAWKELGEIDVLEEPPSESVVLRLWKDGGSLYGAVWGQGKTNFLRIYSQDEGKTWAQDELLDTPSPLGDLVGLVASPGDRGFDEDVPALLACAGIDGESGGHHPIIALSEDNGETWDHKVILEDVSFPGGPIHLTPIAEGMAITYVSADRELIMYRLDPDTISGDRKTFKDWHHDDTDWLSLLKGQSLEPQTLK